MMNRRTRSSMALTVALGLIVPSLIVPSVTMAQGRLSLAERVERLEARQPAGAQPGANPLDALNRIDALQAEVQALRNQIEQQQFELDNLKRSVDQQRAAGGGAPGSALGNPTATPAPQPGPGGLLSEAIVDNQPPAGTGTDLPLDEIPPGAPELGAAPAADERSMYDVAFNALRDGRYAESARSFTTFLAAHPNGELAPNALYWLGESYYVTQNFEIGLTTFQDLLTRFPNNDKARDALLKVGYSHFELKQWSEAERALNQVIERYPDTTVARLAQGRLRAIRLEAERR